MEITADDLPDSVRDRFGDDDAAQAAVDAVLVAARHYCGWHVSPVREDDEITLDGPGACVLDLPTRKLIELTEVTEATTAVDVARLDWSENGSVRKRSGASWTGRYRAVTVTMTHGFTEDEAADWRRAIIGMVTTLSYNASTSSDGLKRKKVDDVEYEWFDFASAAGDAVYSVAAVLDAYRLPEVLFV